MSSIDAGEDVLFFLVKSFSLIILRVTGISTGINNKKNY